MRSAARMNKLQLKEQQQINHEREMQRERAAEVLAERIARERQQYNHVQSHGYGTQPTKQRSNPDHAMLQRPQPCDRDVGDVEIRVYVRECDGAAAQSFSFYESEALADPHDSPTELEARAGQPHGSGRRGSVPLQPKRKLSSLPAVPTASKQPSAPSGVASTRRPSGVGNQWDGGASDADAVAPRRSSRPGALLGPNGDRAPQPARSTHPSVGSSTPAPLSLVSPSRGEVPRYLLKRKAELQAEKDAMESERARRREQALCPPGQRLVSEEEKAETLALLSKRRAQLEGELNRLPLRYDTQAIKQKRGRIEDELHEIDDAERKFQTKRNLYVPVE